MVMTKKYKKWFSLCAKYFRDVSVVHLDSRNISVAATLIYKFLRKTWLYVVKLQFLLQCKNVIWVKYKNQHAILQNSLILFKVLIKNRHFKCLSLKNEILFRLIQLSEDTKVHLQNKITFSLRVISKKSYGMFNKSECSSKEHDTKTSSLNRKSFRYHCSYWPNHFQLTIITTYNMEWVVSLIGRTFFKKIN